MAQDTIPVLAHSGDPIEQEICKYEDQLRLVLQPYSEVWFNHVMIRREGDNSIVEKDWMNFAGANYSALVRVFHAWSALQRLNKYALQEVPAAKVGGFLLHVHEDWANFWEHIGSAIDNLALACQTSVPPVIKDDAREVLMKRDDDICYAYNRRTQFIHSRIVPATIRDDIVTFRIRLEEQRCRHLEPKESRWDLPYDKELALGDVLPKEWEIFLKAMEKNWFWLLSRLRDADEGRQKLMDSRFGGMSSDELRSLVLEAPIGMVPISNTEFRSVEKPKTTPVQNNVATDIAQGPGPSGVN